MTDTEHRTLGSARANLGHIVRNAARRRRTVITDGRNSAVVMSIDEVHDLEGRVHDLEDRAALGEWRRAGSPCFGSLEDSARELGIVIPETHERAA